MGPIPITLVIVAGSAGFCWLAWRKLAIVLAVTAAVLYGFRRRFVVRPRRLEPNREAILVLSLILAIMATYFLYDGFNLDAVMNGNGEGDLKVGARTTRDLTWKEALDAFSCTECGRCPLGRESGYHLPTAAAPGGTACHLTDNK